MCLWKRFSKRWYQFRDDVSGLVTGLQLLIVNLAYIQLRLPGKNRIVIIVDSWREAMILWLLWAGRALPRYKVWVIRRAVHLDFYADADFDGELLLVTTSRAFTKHYQLLADLRRQRRLIVL